MVANDVLAEINETLDVITLIETEHDEFRLVGNSSPWIKNFCPDIDTNDAILLKEAFVFLEGFIEQSREHFQANEQQSLGSGPWSEQGLDGVEYNLSATTLKLGQRLAIQLRNIPSEQLYHRRVFQKAREYSLEYERLQNEMAHKELLIYAIVHDLSGPMTGIAGILELLARVVYTEEEHQRMLDLALNQIGSTHDLINSILTVFAEQEQSFDPAAIVPDQAPQIGPVLESVVNNFRPAFRQEGVSLEFRNSLTEGMDRVIAEEEKLARVFTNLLENALRYSPVNSQVSVILTGTEDKVTVSIADQGPGVPTDIVPDLFQRFAGGRKYGGKAGFGLYYCKMCVNKWGGEIRYHGAMSEDSDRLDVAPSGGAESKGVEVKGVEVKGAEVKGACFQIDLLSCK